MDKIYLRNFILEKFDLNNEKHLELIKKFDSDKTVKKYIFPNDESFYDLVTSISNSNTIFNSFYVIYYEDRIIGYVEIENMKDTYLNCALLKEERTKGIGTKFLNEIALYLLLNYKDKVDSVNAMIESSNKASINATKKSGFTFIESDNELEKYSIKR